MGSGWDWSWLLQKPVWADNRHEVLAVGAGYQIFCQSLILVTALTVLFEIRKGPWFVSRVVIAIATVAVSIIMVQLGIIRGWYDTNITNAIGEFFFCTYQFLDIVVYWTFSVRYWETSFHITSFLRRQAAEDEDEYEELIEKQQRKAKCMAYVRVFYVVVAVLSVFGWGVTDSIYEFYAHPDEDTRFLEVYLNEGTRGVIFGIQNYAWLILRFTSICFFANALWRFWVVFREVNDEGQRQERGSFFVHLILVIVYFLALAFAAGFFVFTADTGHFYSRLWLWSFMLSIVVGFSNYILIIIVAKEMFVYYQANKKNQSSKQDVLESDI